MARPLDVCIRGGGIVGHTLALLLARERLRVGLVAPVAANPGARTDVRAYALNFKSRELLLGLRCWPEAPHVTPVLSMHVKETGAGVVNFAAAQYGAPALAWIVDVPALESQLAEAVRFQSRIELCDTSQKATLTVVCEGQSSASRRQLGAEQEVTAYPQWAIAARVRCEIPHQQAARQWFTPRDILAFLPLDGEHGNSAAIVWSVDEALKTELLATDADGFAHRLQLSSENQLGRLELLSERATWPLQLAMATRWCGVTDGQAWVLAGDAAHSVHPLAGQGLNLGLADARALAQALAGQRDCGARLALRAYERERKAAILEMHAVTHGLMQLFSATHPAVRAARNLGLNLTGRLPVLPGLIARRAARG